MNTKYRMDRHLISELGVLEVRNVNRVALQDLLDRKAGSGLSFSLVGHLRWDLRHIFRVAVAEGIIERNPGELLFTPQNATRAVRRAATAEEMARVFSALDLRERLILKLAGIAGMRPGEIPALQMSESGATVRRDPTAGVPRGY
jgi:site-specific recombinase XerC